MKEDDRAVLLAKIGALAIERRRIVDIEESAHQGFVRHLCRVEVELNNLRSALHWAAGERGDRDLALRLAGSSRWLWLIGGISAEGIEWYARLELGLKIQQCVDKNGECRFEAEY